MTETKTRATATPATERVAPSAPGDFYRHQRRVAALLIGWGSGSVIAGGLLTTDRSERARGMAHQHLIWGAIDLALGLAGLIGASARATQAEAGAVSAATEARDRRNLERLFWVNGALDIGYVAIGLWLRRGSLYRRGAGDAVIAQGLFLLIFDVVNALILRRRHAA
ncbi:MAG: hypothetical protein NZ518_09990 [Dehalococcoidia bacterium]|nr:hypothetical protein [Dehalococcoidia bacterium]